MARLTAKPLPARASSDLWRDIRRNLWIYIVLIPPFALLFIFSILPILQSFILSFQHWTLKSVTWAGLDNFQTLLEAERSLLSARDGMLSSQADQTLAVAQLYRALGGGWDPLSGPQESRS